MMNTMNYQILQKRKLDDNFDPEILFLKGHDYSVLSEKKE